jgi:hypothetical protein
LNRLAFLLKPFPGIAKQKLNPLITMQCSESYTSGNGKPLMHYQGLKGRQFLTQNGLTGCFLAFARDPQRRAQRHTALTARLSVILVCGSRARGELSGDVAGPAKWLPWQGKHVISATTDIASVHGWQVLSGGTPLLVPASYLHIVHIHCYCPTLLHESLSQHVRARACVHVELIK